VRVLMLSKACLVGIYQRKLEEIARQPGVTALKVLVPPFWKDERGITPLERAYTDGYDLTAIPIRWNGNFHLHHYPTLGQVAREFQPDVFHIDEEPYNLATWLALRVAKANRAKSLFFSWQNICRGYPPPFRWGEQWVLRNADYALAGTESAAEVWRGKGYSGPLSVIPQFGVDSALFQPDQRTHSQEVRIGFVGRLVPEKGVDLLLDALAAMKTSSEWRLMLVGGGPEEAALKSQAARLGIAEKVRFVGQVPSLQMPEFFRELDVLVIPSRTMPNWKEQFGRVIIEAMASEVAVIGSDSGAIPDVIGEAGLIFPEGNIGALSEALLQLIDDKASREALARAGQQRALEQFTQEQIARQTVEVYRAMLSS
jgi:glycosyltransferase involved in cell wall biosynthesis